MRRSVVMMSAVVALAAPPSAWAQQTGTDPTGPDLAQTSGQQRSFNIPAQPLSSALNAFGTQAGVQVSVEASVARGLQSQEVVGAMSIDAALRQLLAGTGLVARFTPNGGVMLSKPDMSGGNALQLDPVQVQGMFPVPSQAMIDNLPPPYAGGQVATGGQLGLLGNRSVMDTPFNQTSYTAKKAQEQQAKTVKDVLLDDPSIRFGRADGSPGDDFTTIRGFVTDNSSISYGGLYGMLPSFSIMAELPERVEVLKGPSAMLNGMAAGSGNIGGTINLVPKRAPDDGLTQITASYASASQFGAHADLARRFGPDKQFGVRFNGVYKAGQTDVKWNSDKRSLGVLGLDFRGERVRLSADLGYQYQYIGGLISYLGLNNNVPLPWAPNARNNPSGQPWAYQERKDLFGVWRAEVDIAENVTAYAAFGAHDFRLTGLWSANVNATSFYGAATSSAPLNNSQYRTLLTGEAGLRAAFDTGPIGHELALTGTTYSSQQGSASVTGTAFATNFYNPNIVARPNLATPSVTKTSTQSLSSLGIADTLSGAGKRVQLTAGVRLQQVQAANFAAATGLQTSSYDQSAVSPSVALVVKPFWQNVSFYANWIQGLQQGAIVGAGFTNAGEVFPPYKSTQYEAGVKVDWGRLTTTASFFQISQPSILTNVATNTQFLGGEQRNQGLELNFFGEITEGWRVLGGAMFLSAVLTKTQRGATDGWIAPFSPGAQFNIASEWDLPFVPGLTLNGRIVYTGAQFIDTLSPRRSLPEWTRFDIGARYAFENPADRTRLVVARFNIDNLLDSNYWASGGSATSLYLGAPRTFRLSLSADF